MSECVSNCFTFHGKKKKQTGCLTVFCVCEKPFVSTHFASLQSLCGTYRYTIHVFEFSQN